MKRPLFVLLIALSLFGSSSLAQREGNGNKVECSACDQQKWSYSGATGPDAWGKVCAPICADGGRQSPIAIAGASYVGTLPSISYNRHSPNPTLRLINYGFTPKISYSSNPEGTYIQFSDSQARYRFSELHFHIPSEHTVNNQIYDMEMHLVHTDTVTPGRNVAIAVLIKEGPHKNPKFDQILGNLPEGDRCQVTSIPYQNVYDLLPADRRYYYTYAGSLTTPDCGQTVKFVVLSKEIELSHDQIEAFRAYLKRQGFEHTNRPLQDTNGRKIETNVPKK